MSESPFNIDPHLVLWEEDVPAGTHWSGSVRRGTTLRLIDMDGGANISTVFYNADEKLERYNMPDTLKAQHIAYLTAGRVLYSDMGRVLCSVIADTCGWHDTLSGMTDAAQIRAKYGDAPYQSQHNAMYRNARDSLLIEVGKYGLGKRDLMANVNFFSRVVVEDDGSMRHVPGNSKAGDYIDLRCDMNVLVALSSNPHPLDANPQYTPKPLKLIAWHCGTAGPDDQCRNACAENQRGFANTDRLFR